MSTLRADSIANRAGTGPAGLVGQSAAKAWINFDGTGTTNRASFNVSSRTNVATGNYTVNLTSAMSNSNFVVSWAAAVILSISIRARHYNAAPASASSLGLFAQVGNDGSAAGENNLYALASVHGDLA